jgi:leader peptidase (prepilin peptidase)/N-methyltransferase
MAADPLRIAMAAWALAVGAVVGSFLNVVIARVPAGESVVRPRSRCPGCGAPIAWYDNVPILSWLALRGRCRRCGARISPRYLAVELLGAGAGLLAFARHGLSAAAAAELAFVALLVALAFIDLATWLLPHALTWPLLAAGLAAAALGVAPAPSLASSAAGAAAGFAAFALVAFVGRRVARKEAMGAGDVWLLAGLGAWLGLRALLPVVLLASIEGSVVGLLLLAIGKAQPGPEPAPSPDPEPREAGAEEAPATEDAWVPPRNAIPFGPFLVAGALEWLYLAAPLAALVPALDVFR